VLTLAWYFYLALVAITSRIKITAVTEDSLVALRERRPAVYTFWYQHILFLIYFLGTRRMPILLTPHGRSERLLQLAGWMGMKVARGTFEGGGRHALLTLLETLKAGTAVSIPADGSRGPERKCKAGCIILSQEAAVPIVPVAWRAFLQIKIPRRHGPIFVPLPFNSIEVRLGAPLTVSKHYQFNELETVRTQLTTQLDRLFEERH
jgi:lysophospholipid acyltransferase (LPLAT)-like uncharacterized protein